MKRILVTNDDGVFSEGIQLLAKALAEFSEVIVVAPDREQSASGHSLTLHRPLRMVKIEDNVYSVDGTPTDCVNLGVLWLLEENPPDLVVSGINFGFNLGDDVTYSGTVSATFEGTLLGIPSVAFSQEVGEHFSFATAASFAGRLVKLLCTHELPRDLLLNVNIPAGDVSGVRFTKLGHRVYKQSVVEKTDPRGRRYFWIAGTPEWQNDAGTDHEAGSNGWISITPLHLDLTDYRGLEYQRKRLVRDLRARGIRDERVLQVMYEVPRHEFVRRHMRNQSYADFALPLEAGQTISQPYVVARMTEMLDLSPEHTVLEIGTGSGYQTAILARLARWVYSLERVAELAQKAIPRLRDLGIDNVKVQTFDGTIGWSDGAPFDRILVTAGAPDAPKPLLDQLAVGGLLVVPIGDRESQRLVTMRRLEDGRVQRSEGEEVVFVPLVGRYGWQED